MSLYIEASRIVKEVYLKKASVKTLVFASSVKNKKALHALVCETLKYKDILQQLVEKSGILKFEKSLKKNDFLSEVLLYDHLLGRGVCGRFKDIIKKHKNSIHVQCELMKVKAGVTDIRQLCRSTASTDTHVPKYVRVNTILTNTVKAIEDLSASGFDFISLAQHEDRVFEAILSSLEEPKHFLQDPHVPNLLVFHHNVDLHQHPLYISGEIIIQDKASCFAAHILSPVEGTTVIDCCAAPGNKTSHLAAIMNNNGTIYAFDKDKKRLATLKKLTAKSGAKCIVAECRDFLTIDPNDDKYCHVEYILVDPSCSGSGMINRIQQCTDESDASSKDRLVQLSSFQISILKHAFEFPNVKRVVYSTCSIHEEENELVVEKVYLTVCDRFEFENVLPLEWQFRGCQGYEHAQYCLRMSPTETLTNGFFLACFKRKSDMCC